MFTSLLVCVLFVCVASHPHETDSRTEQLYSNSWAVELKGGPQAAQELARKHGFIYKGQVGSLEGVYHFIHEDSPSRERRSATTLHPKHHDLIAEEHVMFVEQQVVKNRVKRDHSYKYSPPSDAKWKDQWYLHRSSGHHMNVELAWEQNIIGRGSVVSILDDGLEHTHPDLHANYDPEASYDFNSHDADPFPRYDPTNENKHGTRCAGEVAASRDGKCGVGAAYGAKVGGVRMLDGDITDVVEASSLSFNPQHIEIYSSSWGPNDDGKTVDGPGRLAKKAFQDGIDQGRSGLGSIFVWAAGNGGRYGDSCNCDGYAVSPYTISVGSASEKDKKPWYLELCSSTLASTYSSGGSLEKQIVSTDIHGVCTAHHTGTSAAAPLAAGLLSLALEANRNLTWRDMQYLMVYSSNPHFPQDSHWQTNGAGLMVSHLYGYGIIDSAILVNRARNWITVPARSNCTINVTSMLEGRTVASSGKPLVITITSECGLSYLEHTQAITTLKLLGGYRGDISIHLISPMKTDSTLLPYRNQDSHRDGFHKWPFMSVFNWGEAPKGDWQFKIETRNKGSVSVEALELVLFGTRHVPRVVRDVPMECDQQCKGGCAQPGAQYCDVCKHVRVASTLECVEKCPVGTFKNYHMCRDCAELCAECNDDHTCLKCQPGAVKLATSQCATMCPELTYPDADSSCQRCHHSCLSCDGPNETNCTDCPGQLSLENGACILRSPSSCPTGKYFDHRALECRSCHTSCMNCTGKERKDCIVCRDGYILTNSSECVISDEDEDSLLTSCESGNYLDTSNGTTHCTPCPSTCTNCTDGLTCTACVTGYYLTSGGHCVTDCPQHTIADSEAGLCVDTSCHEVCLTCFGSDINQCVTCAEGSLFYQNTCLQQACPDQTFLVANSSCQECHDSCTSCTGPLSSDCLSCSNATYFYLGQCLASCPSNTFPSGTDCEPCPSDCVHCSSSSVCTSCSKGYLLMESSGVCVNKCPDGYVRHVASHTCKQCLDNCKECSDLTSCERCEGSFVYYAPNRSCLSHCPDGYYKKNNHCFECQSPCSSCKSEKECILCGRGSAMDKMTNICTPCCNADRASISPCCDCDANDHECVWVADVDANIIVPSPPPHSYALAESKTLIIIAIVVAILVITAAMLGVAYFIVRQRNMRPVKKYHQLPPGEGVESLQIKGPNSERKFYSGLNFPMRKLYQKLSDDQGLVVGGEDSESESEIFSAKT